MGLVNVFGCIFTCLSLHDKDTLSSIRLMCMFTLPVSQDITDNDYDNHNCMIINANLTYTYRYDLCLQDNISPKIICAKSFLFSSMDKRKPA